MATYFICGRSTPVKLQTISRLSYRVGFDENDKTVKVPERVSFYDLYLKDCLQYLEYCIFQKFESTESFDSEISSVENKSKFKENIELIQSHRNIKSFEIQMETLQAQCKDVEHNLMEVNELLQKEREDHGNVYMVIRVPN